MPKKDDAISQEALAAEVAKHDAQLLSLMKPDLSAKDMIKLQTLINKRNEAFQLMSDQLRKQQEAQRAIINNMR